MSWLMCMFGTALLPTMPLVLPYSSLLMLVVAAVLVFCLLALWFQRDRNRNHKPKPKHSYRQDRHRAARVRPSNGVPGSKPAAGAASV
jgi:hypothetical protein